MPRYPSSLGRLSILSVVASLASTGCAEQEPGTLNVVPQLGPTNSCDQFGVVTVRATLDEDLYVEEADCGEDLTFSELPAGRYDLRVEALDAEGLTIMDNGGDTESLRASIPAGAQAEADALLTATPAELNLRWRLFLSEGVPAQCSHPDLDIVGFRVSAWDAVGDLLHESEFRCDATPDDNLGYHRVEDPDRNVKGTAVSIVDVVPFDRNGDAVHDQSFDYSFDVPGPGRALYFTVDCTMNVCVKSPEPVNSP